MKSHAAGVVTAVGKVFSLQRYFQVMQGCARAAQLGLEQKLQARARAR